MVTRVAPPRASIMSPHKGVQNHAGPLVNPWWVALIEARGGAYRPPKPHHTSRNPGAGFSLLDPFPAKE
jgi:hypothetical protein